MGAFTRQRNDIFTFKHFQVDQSGCAMRISSDATIFGAYVPVGNAQRLLDIGTGTGVLALMMAQRCASTARIDAVEVNTEAAERARVNAVASPFASMISVNHQSIQDFAKKTSHRYDLIFSNPPFFQNSLPPSSSQAIYLAKHSHEEGLDFASILTAVKLLLDNHGVFWVLLPKVEGIAFTNLAANAGLFEIHRVSMRHKAASPINRMISAFSRVNTELTQCELIRYDADNAPSSDLRALLAPYLLYY